MGSRGMVGTEVMDVVVSSNNRDNRATSPITVPHYIWCPRCNCGAEEGACKMSLDTDPAACRQNRTAPWSARLRRGRFRSTPGKMPER